ncbi:MAG: hypothetical protein NVSMB38_07060 [Ktedonobacteraceae bacterium]
MDIPDTVVVRLVALALVVAYWLHIHLDREVVLLVELVLVDPLGAVHSLDVLAAILDMVECLQMEVH